MVSDSDTSAGFHPAYSDASYHLSNNHTHLPVVPGLSNSISDLESFHIFF